MAVVPKIVRIQQDGQIILPAEVRRRLGLKQGDLVAIVETPDGILITPQEAVVTRALDHLGAILREQALSLEDLIESGRTERAELIREQYGLDPSDEPAPGLR